MAKDARLVRDPHQKEIVRLFSAFDGSKNRRKPGLDDEGESDWAEEQKNGVG